MAIFWNRGWVSTKGTHANNFTAGQDLLEFTWVKESGLLTDVVVEALTEEESIGFVISPKGALQGEKVDVLLGEWRKTGTGTGGGSSAHVDLGCPTVNDDSSLSYEVGSLWFSTERQAFWVCTDATVGAAVWVPENHFHIDTVAPTVTDDVDNCYFVGFLWYDSVTAITYVCVDETSGAAVWVALSGAGSNVISLDYDIPTETLTLTTDQPNSFSTIIPLGTAGSSDYALNVVTTTTVALPGAPVYNNGVAGVGATLTRTGNGALPNQAAVVPFVGMRFLVWHQVDQTQNGVYEVTDVGSAGTPYILTRTTDSDQTLELDNQIVIPSAGTNKGKIYGQQTLVPILGTNNVVYTLITSLAVTQQGTGTQVLGQFPWWTGVARQLSKGDQVWKKNTVTGSLEFKPFDSTVQKFTFLPDNSNVPSRLEFWNEALDGYSSFESSTLNTGAFNRWILPSYETNGYWFSDGSGQMYITGLDANYIFNTVNINVGGTGNTTFVNDAIIFYDQTVPQLSSDAGMVRKLDTFGNLAVSFPPAIYFSGTMTLANHLISYALGNLVVGPNNPATNMISSGNTIVGSGNAGSLTTGGGNIITGTGSGINLTTGSLNYLLGTAAGNGITTADGNLVIGINAGGYNNSSRTITIGNEAQMSGSAGFDSATDNVLIGWNGRIADNKKFSIAIGSGANATASNQVVFGASSYINIVDGYINDFVIGNPLVGYAFAPDVRIRPSSIFFFALPQYNDRPAGGLHFETGAGTGSANTGSEFWFSTPDPTASGNTVQLITRKMAIKQVGQLVLDTYGVGTYTGTATRFLAVDATGNVIEEAVPGGGGGTPGGSDTQLQYNNAGVFGGITGVIYNGANVFANDNVFWIVDDADNTKQLQFSLGTQTTGTVSTIRGNATVSRSYSLPDADGDFLLHSNVATVTNKTIDVTNTINTKDSTFRIHDDADDTKRLNWQLSGITTGTTRTITAIDMSGFNVLSSGLLTSTRIPYWSAAGLTDSANLFWDNGNTSLSVLGAGTAAIPTLTVGAAGNGIYYPGTNTLSFATAGAQRFQLDGTSFNSVTTGAAYLRRAAGAAATPSFAFNGTVNTGMWLDGTSLSFSVAGVDKVGITSAGALTIFNPANTFEYSITPAAIAANRILNLPLITATDTLAVLGLAQTFSQNQTFSADIARPSTFVAGGNGAAASRFTVGLYTTNSPSFKLTNGGGGVAPTLAAWKSASAAGNLGVVCDSTSQLVLTHGNGTTHIAGAGFQLTNLDNTAGSEDSDLIILTQAAGAAMSQKMRISNLGNIVLGAEAALATGATDGHMYIPTCAGTPTGAPTAYTGKVAMIFDTTNNKLYIYDGGWLGGTVPGAFV